MNKTNIEIITFNHDEREIINSFMELCLKIANVSDGVMDVDEVIDRIKRGGQYLYDGSTFITITPDYLKTSL